MSNKPICKYKLTSSAPDENVTWQIWIFPTKFSASST